MVAQLASALPTADADQAAQLIADDGQPGQATAADLDDSDSRHLVDTARQCKSAFVVGLRFREL